MKISSRLKSGIEILFYVVVCVQQRSRRGNQIAIDGRFYEPPVTLLEDIVDAENYVDAGLYIYLTAMVTESMLMEMLYLDLDIEVSMLYHIQPCISYKEVTPSNDAN